MKWHHFVASLWTDPCNMGGLLSLLLFFMSTVRLQIS